MVGVGRRFIHLVDGHDDGSIRRFGVIDRFDGLRHDAVVRGHHQHGDVRQVRAAGAHGCESLMARSVQECDGLAVHRHLIRADMLRDAAGLARGNARFADGVQDGGLAVVDVAHDHDDRRALFQILVLILIHLEQAFLDGNMHLVLHLRAQLLGHQAGGVEIDDLGDGCHDAQAHQLFDDLRHVHLQAAGKLTHRDLVGNGYLQLRLTSLFQLDALQALGLCLALFLERLLAAVVAARELLFVARGRGLAAVLHIFRGSQLGVFFVELIQIHVRDAGIHRDGDDLPLLRRGLVLLLGLGGADALFALGRAGRHNGAVGLFQDILFRHLGRGRAGKVRVEACLGIFLRVMLEHMVQLGFCKGRGMLFRLAQRLIQKIDELLILDIEVLCYIAEFVFDDY